MRLWHCVAFIGLTLAAQSGAVAASETRGLSV